MKNNFIIFVSAVLVAVALVASAYIIRPQVKVQKEIVTKEQTSYRYQFIKSEMYKQFTVFDRKTGIVYQYGESNGDEVSLAIDLPNAGMSFKSFHDFLRPYINTDD